MLGALTLDPTMPVADLLAERLLTRSGRLRRGRRFDLAGAARSQDRRPRHLGNATFQIRSVVSAEPDKLAGGVGFGPRIPGQRSRPARHRVAATRQPGALDLSGKAAGQRGRRSRRDRAGRRCAKRAAARPAGKSAAATTPRRSLSAPSAASPSSSPWSASPRCWSAASASPTPSKAISIAAAT